MDNEFKVKRVVSITQEDTLELSCDQVEDILRDVLKLNGQVCFDWDNPQGNLRGVTIREQTVSSCASPKVLTVLPNGTVNIKESK